MPIFYSLSYQVFSSIYVYENFVIDIVYDLEGKTSISVVKGMAKTLGLEPPPNMVHYIEVFHFDMEVMTSVSKFMISDIQNSSKKCLGYRRPKTLISKSHILYRVLYWLRCIHTLAGPVPIVRQPVCQDAHDNADDCCTMDGENAVIIMLIKIFQALLVTEMETMDQSRSTCLVSLTESEALKMLC
jgi:hypothetical protein